MAAKPQPEHVSVYLIAEAYKLFSILSLPTAAPFFSLRPYTVCACEMRWLFPMRTRIITFYDCISWTTRKMIRIAPAPNGGIFRKICSNKFDTEHDNFIYERDTN